MIRSMTGFGKAEQTFSEMVIRVEIRSLNGKQLDINFKAPPLLKPYEIEIRNILKDQLHRGSLDVTIQVMQNGAARPMEINTDLAMSYYQSINQLASALALPQNDVISALLKLPDVVVPATDELSEAGWKALKGILHDAAGALDLHRQNEGKILEADLLHRVQQIEGYQEAVKQIEPERKNRMRQRLEKALEEWMNKEQIDQNRLEQELIFYIEKFDISEEQVRLANHCRYFREVLKESDHTKGKKLNFILQEMGREINTTGAKANDAALQRYVVKMKDELEKAKEQVMNVL